jgi:hypothetical protein
VQLGHGRVEGVDQAVEPRPRRVQELVQHRVVRLFCGFDSCAAMTSEGAIFVWGGGRLGQLGLGRSNLRDVSLPVRCSFSLNPLPDVDSTPFFLRPRPHPHKLRHPSLTGQDIVALSFGVNHGACVHRNGSLQMWGSGFYQGFVLGQGGKSMASDVPVDIELPMSATDVSCGDTFVLAAAVGGGNLCDVTVPALPLRVTCCADSLGGGVRAVGWAWATTTTGGSRSRCVMCVCVRAPHSLADALRCADTVCDRE